MMKSLYAAVSGIVSHQKSMDVTGNNIANVNTIGFKQGRTVFEDLFSQTLRSGSAPSETMGGYNYKQTGTGVSVAAIDNIYSQGAIKSTQRTMDIAIEGKGFFVVKAKNSTTELYTRAGDFNFDNDGYLTSPTGYIVQGWMADPKTGEIISTLGVNGDPVTSAINPTEIGTTEDGLPDVDANQPIRPIGDIFLSKEHQIMAPQATTQVVYNAVLSTAAAASMHIFTKMYTQANSNQKIFDALSSNGHPLELSTTDKVSVRAHATGVTNVGTLFNDNNQPLGLSPNYSTISFNIRAKVGESMQSTVHTYTYSTQSESDKIQNDHQFTTMQGLLDEINTTLSAYGGVATMENGVIKIVAGDVSTSAGAIDFDIETITTSNTSEDHLNAILSSLKGPYHTGDSSKNTIPTNRSSDQLFFRKVVSGSIDFNTFAELGQQIEDAINGNVVSTGFRVGYMDNEFGMTNGQSVNATITLPNNTVRNFNLVYSDTPTTATGQFHTITQLASALNSFLGSNGNATINVTGGIDIVSPTGINYNDKPTMTFNSNSAYLNEVLGFLNGPLMENQIYSVPEISATGKYVYSNYNAGSIGMPGIYGYTNGQKIAVSVGSGADTQTQIYTYVENPSEASYDNFKFNTYQGLVDQLNMEYDGVARFMLNASGNIDYEITSPINQDFDSFPTMGLDQFGVSNDGTDLPDITSKLERFFTGIVNARPDEPLTLPITYSNGILGLTYGDDFTMDLGGATLSFTYVQDVSNPAQEFNSLAGLVTLVNSVLATNKIGGSVAASPSGDGLVLSTTNWTNDKYSDISFKSTSSVTQNLLDAFSDKGNNTSASFGSGLFGLQSGDNISLNVDGSIQTYIFGTDFNNITELVTRINNDLTAKGVGANAVRVNTEGGLSFNEVGWGSVTNIGLTSSNTSFDGLLSRNGFNNIASPYTPTFSYLMGLEANDTISVEVKDWTNTTRIVTYTFPNDFKDLGTLSIIMNGSLSANGIEGTFTGNSSGGLDLSTQNWKGTPTATSIVFGSSSGDLATALSVFNTGVQPNNPYSVPAPAGNLFGLSGLSSTPGEGDAIHFNMFNGDGTESETISLIYTDSVSGGTGSIDDQNKGYFHTADDLVVLLNDLLPFMKRTTQDAELPEGLTYGVFTVSTDMGGGKPIIKFVAGPDIATQKAGFKKSIKTYDANGVETTNSSIFNAINGPHMPGDKGTMSPQKNPDTYNGTPVTGFKIEREGDAGNNFNSNILMKQNIDILSGYSTFSNRFLTEANAETNMRNIFSDDGKYSFFSENTDSISFVAEIDEVPVGGKSNFVIKPESTLLDMMTYLENFLGLGSDFNDVNNVYMKDGQVVVQGSNGIRNDITTLLMQGNSANSNRVFTNNFGEPTKLESASGGQYIRPVTIFDEQGTPHIVNFEFSILNSDRNEWTIRVLPEEPGVSAKINGSTSNEIVMHFNSNGTPAYMYDRNGNKSVTMTSISFNLYPGNGASAVNNIALALGTPGQRDGLSISNATTTINTEYQDGYELGLLSDMLFDAGGVLQGYYSNGITRSIAKIALAVFQNDQGLKKIGNTMFAETANSGEAYVGEAKLGSRGKIASSALEQSNVELSEEFVSMIVTERGYQANSRVITTSDEMLQELLNLKR